MPTPIPHQLDLKQRRRLVDIKEVSGSNEPFRLFVKRTGVFIRTFETRTALDDYIASAPDSIFSPKVRLRKTGR